MTPLALAISRALIHFVWQGLIVGISLAGVLWTLRRRSPNSRYVAACAALALLAVLPVATTWALYSRPVVRVVHRGPTDSPSLVEPVAARPMPGGWLLRVQQWALPIWSLGVFLVSMRLVLAYKHVFVVRREGTLAGDTVAAVVARLAKVMGVGRSIRVLMSSMSDSPSAIGWLRPMILLPAATTMGLTPLQLEAILAHEIAHIRRYDYLVNMMQMVAETLLFYHPAVWWTSRRMRFERELCCDDLAVLVSGNALRYARALARLEKLRLSTPGLVMASTGGSLLYRIQRLAGVSMKNYGPARMPAVLALALSLLCFVANVSWVRAQDAPGVQVDLGGSSVIHRTEVSYPQALQKRAIAGTVQLEVTLDGTGNVADARVLSGPEELRKPSLESALNWHFTRDAAGGTRIVTISFQPAAGGESTKSLRIVEGASAIGAPRTSAAESAWAVEQMKSEAEKMALDKLKLAELDMLEARRDAEKRVSVAKAELEQASPADRAGLEIKLAKLRAMLESMRPPGAALGGAALVNRTLKSIATPALSEAVRSDLLSRLPVREGDVLTPQSVEETARALRAFDEHFEIRWVATGDGQSELQISVAGAGRRTRQN